jgi:hypothetical protein
MNYTKPEVAVLGQAVRVIENTLHVKGSHGTPDGIAPKPFTLPAYDLDE